MMKFDLAPLLKGGYSRFLAGPATGGLIIVVLTHVLLSPVWSLALFRGCIIGLLDKLIMLHGI